MMDFGFGRFLEMFEERFGRRPTTALLGLIGLAVFGLCARLIYDDIFRPIYDVVVTLDLKSLAPKAALASTSASIAVLILYFLVSIYFNYEQKKFSKRMADYTTAITTSADRITINSQTITAEKEKINAAIEEFNVLIKEAKILSEKLDNHSSSGSPS
jgi:hypothetical protein